MPHTLLSLLLIASTSQVESNSIVVEDLVEDILKDRYDTVAVIPRPILVDKPNRRESLVGSLGPQADYFCEELLRELKIQADGEFEIVDAARMREICRRYSLSDLRRKSIRQRIAEMAGNAELLVIPILTRSTDPARKFDMQCLAIEPARNDEQTYGIDELPIGLSDAAYMGESWELRRWDGNTLKNVGLVESKAAPLSALFGTGSRMEQRQYQWIDTGRPHPLKNGSGFPIQIDILSKGKVMKGNWVGNQLLLKLATNEQPVIRVANQSHKDVYTLLFVDGVNVMGKKLEHPGAAIPKQRHRLIKAKSSFKYEGWYTQKSVSEWTLEPFVITHERDTEAAKAGSVEHLGRITCLFYTVGWQGVPPGDRFVKSAGRVGFGAGRPRPVKLDLSTADAPGLLLSAVTIRYGNSDESKALTP